jgi:ABC-type transport system substrate-binding protein
VAERGSGGRELVRGLVAAAVVLLLMVVGVRTMVARMTAGAASTSPSPTSTSTSTAPSPSTSTSTAPTSTSPSPTSTAPSTSTSTAPSTSTSQASAAPPSTDAVVHRGTLDAMAVRAVVRDALPEIRFCFEWELNAHPDLAGQVTMQFVIREDGTVTDAGVLEDALHDETVTNCFTHVMSHLRFPPPEGGSVGVSYPFRLDGSPDARRPEGI